VIVLASAMFGGPGAIARLHELAEMINLEVTIPGSLMEELGLDEIADPLLELDGRVAAIKVVLDDDIEEIAEKAAVLASELDVKYVITVVDQMNHRKVLNCLDELFEIYASYRLCLCLEPSSHLLPGVYEDILSLIGGVISVSYSVEPGQSADDILRALINHFRLLKFIKIINFNSVNKPLRVFSEEGSINYFKLIRELAKRGYSEYLVLDYDTRGLKVSGQDIVKDANMIMQYLESIGFRGGIRPLWPL